MNSSLRFLLAFVLMGAASTALVGCKKKEAPADTNLPVAEASKQAPAPAATPAPAQGSALAQEAEKLKAASAQTAAAVDQMAATAGDTAMQESQAAAAKMQESAAAATTALQQKAAETTTEPTATQTQAAGLLTRYSGELAMLKTGAVAAKNLLDQNANLLPAGYQAKYQEFNALLPQLGSMVESLKNYQTADMTTLAPKLQADFTKAKSLYGEIRAMLPESLTLPEG